MPTDFSTLLRTHRGIVRKVAASYCSDRDDRDDLAQKIAAALWQAWPTYDRERSFSTWMYRVALNVAISHRRRARFRVTEPLEEAGGDAIGAEDVDIVARQRLAELQKAMEALTPVNRALLLLYQPARVH